MPEVSILFEEPSEAVSNRPKSYKQWKEQQQPNAAHANESNQKKKIVTFDCQRQTNAKENEPMLMKVQNVDTRVAPKSVFAVNIPSIPAEKPIEIPVSGEKAIQEIFVNKNSASPNFTFDEMRQLLTMQQDALLRQNMAATSVPVEQQIHPNPIAPSSPPQIEQTRSNRNFDFQDFMKFFSEMQRQQTIQTNTPTEISQTTAIAPQTAIAQPKNVDHEPSIKDLLTIVMKQQEQIQTMMTMQQQIQTLLTQNSIEMNRKTLHQPKPMGVMTSLEINVQKFSKRNKKSAMDRRIIETPAHSIIESQDDSDDEGKENAEIPCKCACKTPRQPLINRNEENMTPNRPQNCEPAGGWSFYDNILNQVNGALHNSPPPDNRQVQNESNAEINLQRNNNFIASAQFKQFGFQFDDVNVSATSKR